MKKISGIFLILLGLLIIFWTLFESYNIFLGKKLPPQLFQIKEIEQNQFSSDKKTSQPSSLQEKLETLQKEILSQQISKMLPADSLTKLFNLISWSVGAFIFIFGGAKISELGVNILKDKLPIKEKEISSF